MSVFWAKATEDGGFDLGSDFNRARLKESLKENIGKRYRIELLKPERSLSQNKYYWLYLGEISRETGNEPEELHEYFKKKFLPRRFVEVQGEEVEVYKSTTKLNKIEFGEYLDKISAHSGVQLPDPREAGFITNY